MTLIELVNNLGISAIIMTGLVLVVGRIGSGVSSFLRWVDGG